MKLIGKRVGEKILEGIDTPINEEVLFFDTMVRLVSVEVMQKAQENGVPQNSELQR